MPDSAEPVFRTAHDGSVFSWDGSFGGEIVDDLLLWADRAGASDIDLQPKMPVSAKIGGDLYDVSTRSLAEYELDAAVRHIYGDNGPAELNGARDLDRSYDIRHADGRKRFRVNITSGRATGGGEGTNICIRLVPGIPPPIATLGLEDGIMANLAPSKGLVLVTGATGSGKSTLLAAAVRWILETRQGVRYREYGKPVEFVLDKVTHGTNRFWQIEVGLHLRPPGEHRSFSEEGEWNYCLRNAMRCAPTIIGIGEIRDRATMAACFRAALSGHAVMSTAHTSSVAETLNYFAMAFPGDERRGIMVNAMLGMRLIVTQTLLPMTGGGRVACREFLVFDGATRSAFLDRDPETWAKLARDILASGKAEGRRMSDAASELLGKGLISAETFNAVIADGT